MRSDNTHFKQMHHLSELCPSELNHTGDYSQIYFVLDIQQLPLHIKHKPLLGGEQNKSLSMLDVYQLQENCEGQ